MKRADFVKSILGLTGTAFVYGCKETANLIEPSSSDVELSIEDSEAWFNSSYLPRFQSPSGRVTAASIERDFDWSKGVKVKKDKQEFVWAPVKYKKKDQIPTLVSWKEGEEHIQKLAELLKWNIAEGFLVYRGKRNELEGFMIQVAYDPFKHRMGSKIDPDTYTGMILHTDLNESPIRGWRYLDGKLDISFDSEANKRGRIQQCQTMYYQYQTVTGQSCGINCHEVTVTLHSFTQVVCDSGSTYYGSGQIQGYPYYPSGGGSSGYSVIHTPVYTFYSPVVDYDFGKIARHEGEDYQIFMQRLNTTLSVLSMSQVSFDMPFTYMEAALKGLGINPKDAMIGAKVSVSNMSNWIGYAGLVVGTIQVGIAFTDGEITTQDWISLGNLLFAGAVTVLTPAGTIKLVLGGISAGVTIYLQGNP